MGLFAGNRIKKAQKAYEIKMAEAMAAQRNGDIQGYAQRIEEAQELLNEWNSLKGASS